MVVATEKSAEVGATAAFAYLEVKSSDARLHVTGTLLLTPLELFPTAATFLIAALFCASRLQQLRVLPPVFFKRCRWQFAVGKDVTKTLEVPTVSRE
jgi:hypothetical protein